MLSSNGAAFKDDVSIAAYDVFFEGAGQPKLTSTNLPRSPSIACGSDRIERTRRDSEEFGLKLTRALLGVTDEVLDAIDEGSLLEGIEPIVLERTSDVDLSVSSIRFECGRTSGLLSQLSLQR